MANKTRKTVLPNGLTVLSKEIHEVPLVSFWVWYRVGSRNEVAGITGISHWVEHMLFKGTENLAKGEIFKQVSAAGGILNGFTWMDFTTFFETLPSDQLELALRIESDRMVNSAFQSEEVDSERTVIISEREGSENSPTYLLSEDVNATAFKAHPYGHPVVGWKSDLYAIERSDLYSYYRTYYTPNNAVAVAVGDFHTDALLNQVAHFFGPIKRGPAVPVVRTVEPPQLGERRVVVRHPAGTQYLEMSFHAPAASDADVPALFVLDAALSGGKPMAIFNTRGSRLGRSSRLYRGLVEGGVARAAGSSFNLTKDPYLFSIEIALRADASLERAEEIALAELERLRREGISDEERERAIRQIRAQLVYGSEAVTDQGYWLGSLEMVDTYEAFDTLLERIAGVRSEDVQRVASTYLKAEGRTTGTLVPLDEVPRDAESGMEEASSPLAAFVGGDQRPEDERRLRRAVEIPIQRERLGNGVVLLGHRDTSTPAVSIQASITAGSAFDPEAMRGLARMTGAMIVRGTLQRPFRALYEELDSYGIPLSAETGTLTTTLTMRCLREDLARALATLAEVLRQPAFAEEELERLRAQVLTELREQDNNTRIVAERRFLQLAYPAGHPYEKWTAGTEASVRGMTRDAVIAYYQGHFRPDNLRLSIVGDVDFPQALSGVRAVFGDWSASAPTPLLEIPAVPGLPDVRHDDITLAGKTQSDIVMGLPTLSRQDPDFYALSLANLVLGQLGLMGRLGTRVRDEQGMAYYVRSELQGLLGPSPWAVRAGVNPANVERAIESIMAEVGRWLQDPATDQELADGKGYLTGILPLALETNAGVGRLLLDIEFYQLGLDYLQRYPEIIRSLTIDDLRRAAQRWIHPDRLAIVVAGPART